MINGQQLATKVSRLRRGTGLSLQEVADRAGCQKSHIWEIESGKSVNPTLKTIGGLCRAFGVSITEFVSDPEPRSQEFAVTMGSDAMRICIGLAPVTHSIEDIVKWMRAQSGKPTNREG